jgi:hypothetical protein
MLFISPTPTDLRHSFHRVTGKPLFRGHFNSLNTCKCLVRILSTNLFLKIPNQTSKQFRPHIPERDFGPTLGVHINSG